MKKYKRFKLYEIIFLFLISIDLITKSDGRKHHLVLHSDFRRYFPISTFGYFIGGSLEVHVDRFRFYPDDLDENIVSHQFGFSLARTTSNNISPHIDGQYQQSCTLNQEFDYFSENIGVILMKFDIKNNTVILHCNTELSKLTIYSSENSVTKRSVDVDDPIENVNPLNAVLSNVAQKQNEQKQSIPNEDLDDPNDKNLQQPVKVDEKEKNIDSQNSADNSKDKIHHAENQPPRPVDLNSNSDLRKTDEAEPKNLIVQTTSKNQCFLDSIQMKRIGKAGNGLEFSFKFNMFVLEPEYQGLYSLHFHNCLNYPRKVQELAQYTAVDLDMLIIEKNLDNYLSAGEMPLPQIFFSLSIIFFILGAIWFVSIRSRYEETFKIHYLMGVLVFVKALSLLFHSINYHFIAKEGFQVETWAVLYYITHFLKGALLFITILLIGTGWAFIKHILSDKEKKIFMIVIPLQVIANIADIITEESEEGALIHTVWREIFILVDMICCGAILFPVIWSIRHLQEASATDGKAAINLKKLQLFRFFYVMIVFYIYFTRIIVYLVKIAVPFNYEWLDAFFQHAATLILFILTGYHFQPTNSNPYHQLLQDDIEMDEEVLFIQPSTFSEAKKRNRDLESGDVQNLLNNTSYDYE